MSRYSTIAPSPRKRLITLVIFSLLALSFCAPGYSTSLKWPKSIPNELKSPLPSADSLKDKAKKVEDKAKDVANAAGASEARARAIAESAKKQLQTLGDLKHDLENAEKLPEEAIHKTLDELHKGEEAVQQNVEEQVKFAEEATVRALNLLQSLGGRASSLIEDLLQSLIGPGSGGWILSFANILIIVGVTVAFFAFVWIAKTLLRLAGGGTPLGRFLIVAGLASILLNIHPLIGGLMIAFSIFLVFMSKRSDKTAARVAN